MNASVAPTATDDRTYSAIDLTIAAAAGALTLVLSASLYRFTGLYPGFVVPFAAAWLAACALRSFEFKMGMRSLTCLQTVSRNFKQWAFSALGFGLLMPVLFPSGSYDTTAWLVWFNGLFLVGGVLAVPSVKALSAMTLAIAKRRLKSQDRSAQRARNPHD